MLPCTGCYAHEELTLSTFSVEVCLLQILVKLPGFMFLGLFFFAITFLLEIYESLQTTYSQSCLGSGMGTNRIQLFH